MTFVRWLAHARLALGLGLGGLAVVLLALACLSLGGGTLGPTSADAAPAASLGSPVATTAEFAPPAPLGLARFSFPPRLPTGSLAVVLAVVAWRLGLMPLSQAGRPARFPPGLRGRAQLYAYLN